MASLQSITADRQYAPSLRLSFPRGQAPAAQLFVDRLQVKEFLSRDFEIVAELISDEPGLTADDVHGKLLCISMTPADGSVRHFTGFAFHFKRLRREPGIAVYQAILVPWFKLLALRRNSFLFHEQTLKQQAQIVFQGYGGLPAWAWRVRPEHPAHALAMQWAETDHNYLSRRWEAAGYAYWYEHSEDGHILNIGDDTRKNTAPISGVSPLIPLAGPGAAVGSGAISRWIPAPLPGADLGLRDTRRLRSAGASQQSRRDETGALQRGGTPLRERRFDASSDHLHISPGRWFRLSGALDAEDEAREFLILEAHHEVSNSLLDGAGCRPAYRNRFVCQPLATPWHPGLGFNSKESKLLGAQIATVVGPEGAGSLHVDKYGRVQVKLHWKDEEGSRCWVSVGSDWAAHQRMNGQRIAAHPRVGSQVIVEWIHGNPDHPIVTGCVHNQRYMPPWEVPRQRVLTE